MISESLKMLKLYINDYVKEINFNLIKTHRHQYYVGNIEKKEQNVFCYLFSKDLRGFIERDGCDILWIKKTTLR